MYIHEANIEETEITEWLEAAQAAYDEKILKYTNKQLRKVVQKFKLKYPKRKLELIFGMGGHIIVIDGEILHAVDDTELDPRKYRCLKFLIDVLWELDQFHDNGIYADNISTDDI